MIVDSSAVVAVLNQEDGWRDFDTALREANHPQMSAATYVELGIVVDRLGDPSVSRRLDRLLDSWGSRSCRSQQLKRVPLAQPIATTAVARVTAPS